jgi:hypothetical protein
MMTLELKTIELRPVLELACAAYRTNEGYLKMEQPVYDEDTNECLFVKSANKQLIKKELRRRENERPPSMEVLDVDRELADVIQQHGRKLMFNVISGENDFLMDISRFLETGKIPEVSIGLVAYMPQWYYKSLEEKEIKRKLRELDEGFLDKPSAKLTNKNCEIIQSDYSENFASWNICAIIDNKLATWFGKNKMNLGPAILVSAKVKDHRTHWKFKVEETRLNYVKVAQ